MKFLPTVNLWDAATQAAVLNGTLRLQCGQWVRCGSQRPSRFVRTTGTSIWAAHWQGSGTATRARFRALVDASR